MSPKEREVLRAENKVEELEERIRRAREVEQQDSIAQEDIDHEAKRREEYLRQRVEASRRSREMKLLEEVEINRAHKVGDQQTLCLSKIATGNRGCASTLQTSQSMPQRGLPAHPYRPNRRLQR
jgi:hypothetical protein